MGRGKNWYGLGVVLLIISLVHMVFFDYRGHANYALLESVWAVCCFILGLRREMTGR